MRYLLVLNLGSSSLKFAVFAVNKKKLGQNILAGSVSVESSQSVLIYKNRKIKYAGGSNLKNWWKYIHDILADYNISYVGLRMVHGGEEFTDATRVDKSFLQKISKYNKLAPLHNPPAIALLKLVKATWPRVPVAVSFDTAWYRDLPPEAYLYSLPLDYYNKYQIRKYGFHGLSHEAVTSQAVKILGKKINKINLITCHLGAGASITWLVKGKVKDTTMGFSPNEGLTMATRSGDIPASIVLYLAEELKMSLSTINNLLNKKSGLLGLTKLSDLRDILLAAGYRVAGFKSSLKYSIQQKKLSRLALSIYIYDIRRYLASYMAMSKKLDAVVFTGTIGMNSSVIRNLVMRGLNKPSNCKVIIASPGETNNLANKTLKCLIK